MDTKKTSFALGYSLVFHSILCYFIYGVLSTSGMNVWNGAFSTMYGWDVSVLLTMATIGSLIGVLGSILFGQLVAKRGARGIISITMILCGVAVMIFGIIKSIPMFLVCVALFNFLGMGFCNVGSNAVIGNWFPRRKGFILGITTMGLPAASFIFVPILQVTIGSWGVKIAFLVIGGCIALLGIISWFWVRNTPQEVGCLPDNGKFGDEASIPVGQTSTWTIKRLLSSKNGWFISIAYGLLFVVTQGMVSQTVVYLLQHGYEQPAAVSMLSIAAAVGIAGSFIWGILDDKLGTKTASVIYCCWYIVTFIILAVATDRVFLTIGVVMLGASLGGIGNLMPSMIMTTFGVSEFASVSRVVQTAVNTIRSFAFVVMALGLSLFGNYAKTSWILLGLTVVALLFILGIKKEKTSN